MRTRTRRRALHRQHGFTLIEAMISFAILAVGLLGLAAAYIAASRSDGQGMRITQATAVAQSVGHALVLLPWNDPHLNDKSTDNNADPDDQSRSFAGNSPVKADHQLSLPGGSASSAAHDFLALDGVPGALDYNGDGDPDFEVYWNVADCFVDRAWAFECEGAGANANFKQIGIIVRWQRSDGDWSVVSSQFHRYDPGQMGEL